MAVTASYIIRKATTAEDAAAVRDIFLAYAKVLNVDLTFQNFTAELDALPGGCYAAPLGSLLIARDAVTDEPLGAVGFRRVNLAPPYADSYDPEGRGLAIGEVKRLFTYPAARGRGIGRALFTAIMEEARSAGYDVAVLDTLPRLAEAVKLYDKEGFESCAPYYWNPNEGVLFMKKMLR